MKVFIVADSPTPNTGSAPPKSGPAANDRSQYLGAILNAWGLCFAARLSLDDSLRSIDPRQDVLLISGNAPIGRLEGFLGAGGHVIATPVSESLARLAGAHRDAVRETPGRLRFTTPICPGARGEPIWTLGYQALYRADEGETGLTAHAYLFEPGNFTSESLGIWERPVGTGTITAFGYDVAGCITRLRQGIPERANDKPAGDPVPRHTHLQLPGAPHDTTWRPTADLHGYTLFAVVRDALERKAPVPALWQIPDGKSALLVFTGDEDGASQEANRREMCDLEACGAEMTLYVIPNNTSITREDIAKYTAAGHAISVHPDLTPACDKSPADQLAKAEADVLLFREKFGLSVHTVRNHCGMWPGYVELGELWERLGIGMDSSVGGSLYFSSPDGGPYPNMGAALPLPLVREDGSLIDVYEQPFHCTDDIMCHPSLNYSLKLDPVQFEHMFERIFEDATRFFNSPVCVIIHPGNYVAFSGDHGLSLLRQARRADMPVWSMERWHAFWRSRASWRVTNYAWHENHLTVNLAGKVCPQLWVTLPASVQGLHLRSLSANGLSTLYEQVERQGRTLVQIPLPAGAEEVDLVAQYS